MNFQSYLKPGQQLLLQVQREASEGLRTELMIVSIVSLDGNRLTLTMPYGSDAIDRYAFKTDSSFDITTEAMGMGVQVTGHFEKKISASRFALLLESDLRLYQRRISPRLDCKLGVRFSRAAKSLSTMREIWEKNLQVLYRSDAPAQLEGFNACQVNISNGGIRFVIKPPANQGDLCLILVDLEDGKPPVCAIAEIVWTCVLNDQAVTAGMRFINILSDDQKRISAFVEK